MDNLTIREVKSGDLAPLLELYTHLHGEAAPPVTPELEKLWGGIIKDKNHVIVACFDGGRPVASCVVVIIPNLTRGCRPYAVVENVVTHTDYRRQGLGRAVLDFAKQLAERENCYKIMLMTGSKEESTWRFYERAGYNRQDKTAFIQWLNIE